MKSFPTANDLKDCVLAEAKTGKELITFDAKMVDDLMVDAAYIGNGINSGGQAMTISTEKQYPFQAFKHQVIIDGEAFLVVSKRRVPMYKIGQSFSKTRYSYVLTLS